MPLGCSEPWRAELAQDTVLVMLCPGAHPRRAGRELFRAIWAKIMIPHPPRLLWAILAGKVSFPHGSPYRRSASEPAWPLWPSLTPDTAPCSCCPAGLLLQEHLEAWGGGTFPETPSSFGNSPCCFSKSLILPFWLKHTTHFSAAMKINVNKSSAIVPRGQE